MSETRSQVRVMRVNYICDRCNNGNMISTGYALLSHPPQHNHQCEMCEWTQTFKVQYPYTEYVKENTQ